MPWCEPCAKYWTPNSMQNDGTCPDCGEQVTEGHAHGNAAKPDDEKTPWHFKLMVVALVIYLGWRMASLFF